MTNRRRSVRLPDFDYSSQGAYFITIVSNARQFQFGDIISGDLQPSSLGQIVSNEWLATPAIRSGVTLGAFVVMPNHLYAVVWLPSSTDGISNPKAYRRSLGALMSGYKAAVTSRYRSLIGDANALVWQRSFYEHVVRDEIDLHAIEAYIQDNPRRWAEDSENPVHG